MIKNRKIKKKYTAGTLASIRCGWGSSLSEKAGAGDGHCYRRHREVGNTVVINARGIKKKRKLTFWVRWHQYAESAGDCRHCSHGADGVLRRR